MSRVIVNIIQFQKILKGTIVKFISPIRFHFLIIFKMSLNIFGAYLIRNGVHQAYLLKLSIHINI